MPSGLQTEWRNEIGLSYEFIQRGKDNTNDFIAIGFTFNHSSLHSVLPLGYTWQFLLWKRMLFCLGIVLNTLYYFK